MTDDSENSSNFSLNKSSYNDSSFDESTSPMRQAYKSTMKNTTTKSSDDASSCKNLEIFDSECVNRKSSVSPPTWRQRHRNTFKRTIRRFHSVFIAKSVFTGGIDKNSKKNVKSENDNSDEEEEDGDVNNKINKQVRTYFIFCNLKIK